VRALRGLAALLPVVLGQPAEAAAAPKVGTGLALGVAGSSSDGEVWSDTHFHGALRADVLWGRDGARDAGLGPALELGTLGFSDARFLAGATAFLPLDGLLSVSLTPAIGARTDRTGWSPVAGARALFGIRVFNHYGAYDLAGGLLAGFDRDLDADGTTAVTIGAQLDGMVLALPFLLLASWIRGPVQ
jgi:hypothetical protein